MAPWPISRYSTVERRDSFSNPGIGFGNGHSKSSSSDSSDNDSDNDSNNDNDNDNGSSSRESVKIITQQVTSTYTTVQTSTVLVTATEDTDNATFPPNTFTPTTPITPSPTPSDSVTPQTTNSTLSNPSTASATTLPVASIISIILSGLFFITLCLVIYVRNPTVPRRILGVFKRRYHRQSPPTIRSFEPVEYKDYTRDDRSRQSLRSYLALAHLRYASSKASEGAPTRVGGPTYYANGSRGGTPLIFAGNPPRSEQPKPISVFSGFDDLSYAHGHHSEDSKASVKLSDWCTTTSGTPYSIPRSVDQMTAE